MGIPQMKRFIEKIPTKMDDLRVPPFMEPPYIPLISHHLWRHVWTWLAHSTLRGGELPPGFWKPQKLADFSQWPADLSWAKRGQNDGSYGSEMMLVPENCGLMDVLPSFMWHHGMLNQAMWAAYSESRCFLSIAKKWGIYRTSVGFTK